MQQIDFLGGIGEASTTGKGIRIQQGRQDTSHYCGQGANIDLCHHTLEGGWQRQNTGILQDISNM